MPEETPCPKCGAPGRKALACASRDPRFVIGRVGNRVMLATCTGCGRLWCMSRHGLHTGMVCAILWPGTETSWCESYDQDDGFALCRWHLAGIRHVFTEGADLQDVPEEWRRVLSGETAPPPRFDWNI